RRNCCHRPWWCVTRARSARHGPGGDRQERLQDTETARERIDRRPGPAAENFLRSHVIDYTGTSFHPPEGVRMKSKLHEVVRLNRSLLCCALAGCMLID